MGRNTKQLTRRQRAAASVSAGAGMTAYQGASHSDLALRDWQPFAGSPDADLLPELDTLTSRSRDLARNDGLMAGGIQTHRDNIVGAVLRLSALPDYRLLGWTPEQAREWGNKVEAHFRSWADTTDCDAARTLDLLGLTVLALGGEMVNGDAVAIPKWLPRPDSPWVTRLSLLESDRLQTPPHMEGMARIRRGVEFDRDGAPQAYHFQAAHPGDALYLRNDQQSKQALAQAQQSQAATETKAAGLLRHAAGQQDNTHAYTQKIQLLEAGRTADAARIASLQHNLRTTATQHAQAASNATDCRDFADQHQQLAAHLAQGAGVVAELVAVVQQRDAQVSALMGQMQADRQLLNFN